ncbi:MAG: Stf0 family sulfotransferase [Pseudomonadota bacterium]
MGLRELKTWMGGSSLSGEEALRGDSLHLSHLRRLFTPLHVSPDLRFQRPLVVLAFTNRSGSTFLGQLLASMPDLYGFREDLNHRTVASRKAALDLKSLDAYIEHVVDHQAPARARFGLKLAAEQLRLLHMTGIDGAFEYVHVIRIRRRDRVAQAVSLWTAWQTRQWTSQQAAEDVDITYDFKSLRHHLSCVQNAESALDLALSVLPYPVLTVEYETLCKHTEDILSALRSGLNLPECRSPASSRTEQQSSLEKEMLVNRFREDLSREWNLETP